MTNEIKCVECGRAIIDVSVSTSTWPEAAVCIVGFIVGFIVVAVVVFNVAKSG